MITSIWTLLIWVSLLAMTVKSECYYSVTSNKHFRPHYESVIVVLVFIALLLFSGLRTRFNDTELYIYNFINLLPINNEDGQVVWSLGDNPGFYTYQLFLRQYISVNPHIFIFTSAFIVQLLFVTSFYKYSPSWALTIFLYVSSGLFMFTMGAMKQVFAMSIGFYSMRFVFENKWICFVLLILMASTIHPYILMYLIIPIFRENIWNRKIIIALLGAFLVGLFFNQFVSTALTVTGAIGDTYELSDFTTSAGMNIFRVAVFAVTPVLSYLFRNEIRMAHNNMLNICVNMSVISFMFTLMALSGGANFFGRMANYFEPFIYVGFPWIIMKFIPDPIRKIVLTFTILGYVFFLYTLLIKYKGIDIFRHTSVISLFN